MSINERLGRGSYELPTGDTFSQRKIRTHFIGILDNVEQNVAITLYKEVFFQFVRLVWSQFPQGVPPCVSPYLEDIDFLTELKRTINDFSAMPFYNAESRSIHPAFAELLGLALNKEPSLLQSPFFLEYPRATLLREMFRPVRELSDVVPRTFPNWAALQAIKNSELLRESLITWSQSWNLNADWFRDFAVAALCDWLEDRYLQLNLRWSERYLTFKNAIWTVHREDFWGTYDLVAINEEHGELLSLLDEKFKFTWKGLVFEASRWNPRAYYMDEWADECEKKFREKYGEKLPVGTLTRFRTVRDKYLKEIDHAAKKAGLVKTPRRWAINKRLTWAVQYQVQGQKLLRIAETHSQPYRTVADGIDEALNLIGLVKRPSEEVGRPLGKGGTRRLSEKQQAAKEGRLPKFREALKKVCNIEIMAEAARALGVSENYFRREWVPDLLKKTGYKTYRSLAEETYRSL